jgi:hypothetical protein
VNVLRLGKARCAKRHKRGGYNKDGSFHLINQKDG